MPKELQFKQSRLQKILEAKQALEEEARLGAEAQKSEYEAKKKAYDKKTGRRGRPPKAPSDKPTPKKQRNFTDPDSRIMPASGTKSFIQGYNCQAAVDKKAQVVIAPKVTQEPNDNQQVVPLVENIKVNTGGHLPKIISADSGYFSETSCNTLEDSAIDAYVEPENRNMVKCHSNHEDTFPKTPL